MWMSLWLNSKNDSCWKIENYCKLEIKNRGWNKWKIDNLEKKNSMMKVIMIWVNFLKSGFENTFENFDFWFVLI